LPDVITVGETVGTGKFEVNSEVSGLGDSVGVFVAGGREAGSRKDGAGVMVAGDTVETDGRMEVDSDPIWLDGADVTVGCSDVVVVVELLVLLLVVPVAPWVCADPGVDVSEKSRQSSSNLFGIVIVCTCNCICFVPFIILTA
jgi:hypothetical protein